MAFERSGGMATKSTAVPRDLASIMRPGGRHAWYALHVMVLVYMLNNIDRQIPAILAGDIKADFGISDAQLGFLYGTAFAVFYALFAIPFGRLAGHEANGLFRRSRSRFACSASRR